MLEINLHPFPVLYTDRLVLRQISHTDDADILIMRSDKALMQHIDRPMAQTLADAAELVQRMIDVHEKNEGLSWGISLKTHPKLIGTIGFWRMQKEHYRTEIGYMLHSRHHRQGIMYEAAQAAIEFAFKNMKVHSIEANINPDNEASIKLAEKCGFVQEAHFRENYYYNGKFLDSYIFSLINPYD